VRAVDTETLRESVVVMRVRAKQATSGRTLAPLFLMELAVVSLSTAAAAPSLPSAVRWASVLLCDSIVSSIVVFRAYHLEMQKHWGNCQIKASKRTRI